MRVYIQETSGCRLEIVRNYGDKNIIACRHCKAFVCTLCSRMALFLSFRILTTVSVDEFGPAESETIIIPHTNRFFRANTFAPTHNIRSIIKYATQINMG